MGGLDPPTHQARVRAPVKTHAESRRFELDSAFSAAPRDSIAPADAGAMGGRLKGGHDEFGIW